MPTITTTIVTGSREKTEQCGHCGTYYSYTMKRTSDHVRTESIERILTSPNRVQADASQAAQRHARRQLRQGSDPVRCPK